MNKRMIMLKNAKTIFNKTILTFLFSCLTLSSVEAANPLWTFLPQTPTDITVAKGGTAQVIYTVQNQSLRPKMLVMKPIAGVSQAGVCQLPAKGSCTLILNINGPALQGDVLGGPVLCQQGNNLQCFQPSAANSLRIRLSQQPPPVQQYTVMSSAGANGSISPATTQVVNAGTNLAFTAVPDQGFGVSQWLLDGNVVQNGGTNFQLNNIQANHSIEVTFGQATLTPLTQNLTLSINSPGADPALTGNARIIRIFNMGSIPALNVQVNTSALPGDTSVNSSSCTGTLNGGASCDIIITPGGTASLDTNANPCTTSPGTAPVPGSVTVSADNAPSTNIKVLVLGYGCIYQGGFLFSVDDTTPDTGGIGGKVMARTDVPNVKWANSTGVSTANSITDGLSNTNALTTPVGQYPAAQACLDRLDQGFDDWYLPAICELGRYLGLGEDPGCGTTNANLFTTLYMNNLGGIVSTQYWSSTQYFANPNDNAWFQSFISNLLTSAIKTSEVRIRCVRAFAP
ncbi:NHL repeat protein [Legionella birminghamensis]|uniref:NHL repeat protein n=1 Tax=Legionella birminghamensis TaxID=28083 RepID=A0A378I8L6_9GAMM|nr:DUF1566 domain-containing protein [Legionella birminghamensis]KTC68098.1 NHL repeat protein [Legionella birminghamensis]STX31192.1 NHL repeat protein [Legionella birminghamensis]